MAFLDELSSPVPAAVQPGEVEAALALGRLDGALSMAPPATLRLFAARLLKSTLIAALRQEGHAFTDARFHAWFAGLATLSGEPPRHARPPRALGEAILTELAHTSWEPLAGLAARFQAALLAPHDHAGEPARQATHAIVAAARSLLAQLTPSPLPFPALAQLHRAVRDHLVFAPPERALELVGPARLLVERATLPSPRWAIELLWGEHWHGAGVLRHALPCSGLIRFDVLRDGTDPDEGQTIVATALRDVAQGLGDMLAEADRLARCLADLQPGRRRTSRAPALFELLAGFGPLRSSQLETLLGATRLGVRAMLTALIEAGVLERTTLAGVRLYSVIASPPPAPQAHEEADGFAFSAAALGEYNASMAHIDALLTRNGGTPADADED